MAMAMAMSMACLLQRDEDEGLNDAEVRPNTRAETSGDVKICLTLYIAVGGSSGREGRSF